MEGKQQRGTVTKEKIWGKEHPQNKVTGNTGVNTRKLNVKSKNERPFKVKHEGEEATVTQIHNIRTKHKIKKKPITMTKPQFGVHNCTELDCICWRIYVFVFSSQHIL